MHVLVPDDPERRELEPLPGGVTVAVLGHGGPPPDTDFLVADHDTPDLRELIAALPQLRVVQSLSAGVDWLLPLTPGGVTVCDAAGVHDVPVAEWIVGAILGSLKRLPECRDAQLAGESARPAPILDLLDRRVVVLGHGSIGRAVAARLEPFGCTVCGVARTARPGVATLDELPALLPTADVLVLLLPLTHETAGIVDAAMLRRLPDGALVVNAGRGKLVDTAALLAELQAGRLDAALDVTDPEPLPPDHPLRTAPGAFVSPHIAGASPRFLERAYRLVRDQLARATAGEDLRNVVSDGY